METAPQTATMRTARDIPLALRVAAYMVMLGGYLFYCYNFLILDYVRPYLMSSYGMSLKSTANLSVIQNIFVTIGSLVAAPILARLGRRRSLAGVSLAIGLLAALTAGMHTLAGWMGIRAAISMFLGAYYVVAINLTVALFPPQHRAKLAATNSAMFSLSEIMIGGLGAALGDAHWLWMVWLGGVPMLLSPLMLLLTPDDRSFVPYGAHSAVVPQSGGWREMLSGRWLRLTLTCTLLAGLNYTGYQLFSSFVTVYLKHVRGFVATDMGAIVAVIGIGSLLGGFFWAFIADRYGRRTNAIGFLGVAVFIVLFLVAPRDRTILQVLGFFYGVGLSSTYPWGIWFTEIFPARLRPYGAALIHGGHVVSLIAPLIVAWAAERWGLVVAMTFAPAVFLLATLIWLTLPETLATSKAYRGWDAENLPGPAI
jgi:MFS family permease